MTTTILILWLVVLAQAIGLLLEERRHKTLTLSAEAWYRAYQDVLRENYQVRADVLCKNYGCGALALTERCRQLDMGERAPLHAYMGETK